MKTNDMAGDRQGREPQLGCRVMSKMSRDSIFLLFVGGQILRVFHTDTWGWNNGNQESEFRQACIFPRRARGFRYVGLRDCLLTASSGSAFDINSFDCYLESINPGSNPGPSLTPDPDPTHNTISGPGYNNTPPTLTITSNTGQLYYFSEGEGRANLNWTNVAWVDFTSQYTKAHVSNLDLSISAVPEVTSSFTMLGLLSSALMLRRRTTAMR